MRGWTDIASLRHAKCKDGGLVAQGAAGLPSLLYEGLSLALVPPVIDVPRTVTVVEAYERTCCEALVYFAEVEDSATAEMLVGCHCLAREGDIDLSLLDGGAELPDWEGWQAFDAAAGPIGAVASVEERATQPLLVIQRTAASDVLVPLVDEFIDKVDEKSGEIHLRLPNGLLDL